MRGFVNRSGAIVGVIAALVDVRTCLDWDTGASHRDMKDGKEDWYKVADE